MSDFILMFTICVLSVCTASIYTLSRISDYWLLNCKRMPNFFRTRVSYSCVWASTHVIVVYESLCVRHASWCVHGVSIEREYTLWLLQKVLLIAIHTESLPLFWRVPCIVQPARRTNVKCCMQRKTTISVLSVISYTSIL